MSAEAPDRSLPVPRFTGGLPGAITSAARLRQVVRSGLLDTEREEAFDRFARLAAMMLGEVTAFVTVVDERRSFWKACVTASGGTLEDRQNTVEQSFCRYVIGTDRPLIVSDARVHPVTRDNPSVESMGVIAWAGYPVRTPDGQVLGTFCVVGDRPRDWSATDLQVLETLAHAVAGEVALRMAVDDARAARRAAEAEARHAGDLAAVLQESLLPAGLPTVPGTALAGAYRPAGSGVEVLGDFYDAFRVPQGWGVVLGDVCGKGPQAARTTALTRSTVRALGRDGRDPAGVLTVLDEVLADWNDGDGRSPTAVAYCSVVRHAADLVVSLCLAGFPPAQLLDADGQVQEVGELGALLGCGLALSLTTSVHIVAPGATLLLATDGVSEARAHADRSMFGEDRLTALLGSLPAGTNAAHIVDAVIDEVSLHAGGVFSDDVAVLAIGNPAPDS
ncbi:MAG: SpoIIE family protein phosphatase [Pseudonocardia sp.]|nr:SpoIIE family protein phosphatase [Pseudonocardia sp.]